MNSSPKSFARLWPPWFALAALIFCLVALLAICLGPLYTYDGFWHLAMGRDLIEKGLSPYRDHYSFTFSGERVDYNSVLFQALLYLMVQVFGVLKGFQITKFLCLGGALVMLYLFALKKQSQGVVTGLVLVLATTFLVWRNVARPELLLFPFACIAIVLLFKAREQLSTRVLWAMAILMVIWVNSSSSAMVGYALFGAFYIDQGIKGLLEKAPAKRWQLLFGSGALIFLAGFLNPLLSHPVFEILQFEREWYGLIEEYQVQAIDGRSLINLTAIALLLLGFGLWRRHFDLVLILLILGWQAFQITRMVTPAFYIACLILVGLLPEITRKTDKLWSVPAVSGGALAIALGWTLFNAYSLGKYAGGHEHQREIDPFRYPTDVVDWMQNNGKQGNILNDYGSGGFLIWGLGPESKVYIDGRTNVLYPLDHMRRSRNLCYLRGNLEDEVSRTQPDFLLVNLAYGAQDLCLGQAGFEVEYIGRGFALLARQETGMAALGRLWVFPGCEAALSDPALIADQLAKAGNRIGDPLVEPLIEAAIGLKSFGDVQNLITENQAAFEANPQAARFAAWLARREGDWQKVLIYLGWIEDKQAFDLLNAARALKELGDIGGMEGLMYMTLREKRPVMVAGELGAYRELLNYIAERQGFRLHQKTDLQEAGLNVVPAERIIQPVCSRLW